MLFGTYVPTSDYFINEKNASTTEDNYDRLQMDMIFKF